MRETKLHLVASILAVLALCLLPAISRERSGETQPPGYESRLITCLAAPDAATILVRRMIDSSLQSAESVQGRPPPRRAGDVTGVPRS